MAAPKPKKVSIITYQVGFGDCFLMIIGYNDGSERFVMFDFGTMAMPESLGVKRGDWLKRIANDIKQRCNAQLDILVATHRHQDHVLGFGTDGKAGGAGLIIKECKPKLVLQPWTEHPKLKIDAKDAKQSLVSADWVKKAADRSHVLKLENIHAISASAVNEASVLKQYGLFAAGQVVVIGLDAVSNKSAIQNLANMGAGGKGLYLKYGDEVTLGPKIKNILPGVKIKVLGPPTLAERPEVGSEMDENDDEFWPLQALSFNYWSTLAATAAMATRNKSAGRRLFPNAETYQTPFPSRTRWFVRRMRQVRADQLLQLTKSMDKALNNTSLILMFEIGGKKFLFPGDAQWENWDYCLNIAPDKQKNLKMLADTTLYKVGHHGSTNATPQTLYRTFAKKKTDPGITDATAMQSVVSTLGDENDNEYVYGSEANESEVPRIPLIEALEEAGTVFNTRDIIDSKQLSMDPIEFDL